MKLIAPQEESESRSDVAPLIDILFTLIIFFLVTSVFEKEEKEDEVQLQRHGGSSLVNNKRSFYINVMQNGTYRVLGDEVDLDELRVMLMARFKEKPEQPIVLRGDARALHGQTTAALAAASQAGFPSANIAWDTSSIE
jgi:biopolymer transport protein ExbD